MSLKNNRTIIAGILIGTILEWYDFSLVGSLAPIIATLFFPSKSPTLSLVATFGVFATGFIARPLGGAIFGHIGDLHGRRNALSLTILLMAIPSILIGFLPNYKTAGMIAPILLIALRFMQGLATSGEYPGAICVLTEMAPKNRRSLFGSLSIVGVLGGIFLGSLVSSILSFYLTSEQILAWGWRIPFMAGIPLGFIGWYLRRKARESLLLKNKNKTFIPIKELIAKKSSDLVKTTMWFAFSNTCFYLGYVYVANNLANSKQITLQQGFTANSIATIVLAFLTLFFGYLSDKMDKSILSKVGVISVFVLLYPIFLLFNIGTASSLLLGQLILAFLLSIFTGPLAITAADNFSTSTRYTGMALSINIGASLFGGTCPLVAAFIAHQTGSQILPCLYPMLLALICILITFKSKNTLLKPHLNPIN